MIYAVVFQHYDDHSIQGVYAKLEDAEEHIRLQSIVSASTSGFLSIEEHTLSESAPVLYETVQYRSATGITSVQVASSEPFESRAIKEDSGSISYAFAAGLTLAEATERLQKLLSDQGF